MRLNAALQPIQKVAVQHVQRRPKRHVRRAEHRDSDGTHQESRSQDGHDALDDHMNSFSFFSPTYKEDTNSP